MPYIITDSSHNNNKQQWTETGSLVYTTFISNTSVFPRPLLTVVTAPSYIDLMILTSFSLIPFRLRLQYNTSLGTWSYAFSRSTNVQYRFLFPSKIFSCNYILCPGKKWTPKQAAVIQQKLVGFVWNLRCNNHKSGQADCDGKMTRTR